jgi:hypothetical protein
MSEKNYPAISILVIFVVLIIILGFIFYRPNNTPQPLSIYKVDPSGSITPTTGQEPIIHYWRSYENKEYNFTLAVPKNWNEQEYKAQLNGGAFIAFSPDSLPCETCTYFGDGFFSIRVYNEKSYPELYAEFQKRMKNLGKHADYRGVYLGEKVGVAFANTVAVEHQGWVYEVALDKDDGKADINNSPIFKHVLASFKFTTLFNN